MFINKNIEAETLRKKADNNSEKNIPLSGIYKLTTNKISFEMLVINSDDTSISSRFWNNKFTDYVLDKWCDWCEEEGIYLDVGAHTGMYTIASLISNSKNRVVSIEPFPLNFYRIITNLRLNNFNNTKVKLLNVAASDNNKTVKFHIKTPWSYLSKGGKISDEGVNIKAIKLDSLDFSNNNLDIKGIKIDTEGEDLNVVYGAKNIITKYKPKIIIECRRNNILEIFNFLFNLGYKKIFDSDGNNIEDKKLLEFIDNQITKDLFFEIS